MSVESFAIALNHSQAQGTARLVLIGIANHDGDGGAWPSLDTLARYAAVDRRNVLKAIIKLEQLGEIRRHRQAGGTASIADHRRPNLYEFLLRCPNDCDRSSQHRTRRRPGPFRFDSSTGVTEASPHEVRGVTEASPGRVTEASPKPSSEPQQLEKRDQATDRACAKIGHVYLDTVDFCERCGLSRDGHRRKDWITGDVSHEAQVTR